MGWDVVVLGFRLNAPLPPRQLVESVLALSEADAREFVRRLPRVAGANLLRDDADVLLAALKAAGARAELREHVVSEAAFAATVQVPKLALARAELQGSRETWLEAQAHTSRRQDVQQVSVAAAPTLRAHGADAGVVALGVAARAAGALACAAAEFGNAATLLARPAQDLAANESDGSPRWSSQLGIKGSFDHGQREDGSARAPLAQHERMAALPEAHFAVFPEQAAQPAAPEPVQRTLTADALIFVPEELPERFSQPERVTRSPFQPVFHGTRTPRPEEPRVFAFPDRPRTFGQVLRYPLDLFREAWGSGRELRTVMLICGAMLVAFGYRSTASERPRIKRPSYVATHAPRRPGLTPTRAVMLAQVQPVSDPRQRMLLPSSQDHAPESRALAIARIYAELPRSTTSAQHAAEATLEPVANRPENPQPGAHVDTASSAASSHAQAPVQTTSATIEEEDIGDVTGQLDPMLHIVPASMQRSFANVLRKSVAGVHNVNIDWPEGESAAARERNVQCMLVESQQGSGVARVQRLLHTGHEVPITTGMDAQLRDHVETMQAASGSDELDFIPLCLEI